MRGLSVLLRMLGVAVLSIALGGVTVMTGSAPKARAAGGDPDGAVGRDGP